jgi:hypothetical protein
MEQGKSDESYIIAGPTHTLVEAMKLAQRITGVPAPREVPPAMIKAAAALMGVAEKVVPVPDEYSAEFLRISAGVTYKRRTVPEQKVIVGRLDPPSGT